MKTLMPLLFSLTVGLTLAACESKTEAPPKPAAADKAPAKTADKAPPKAAAPAETEIPVPADFEKEVAAQVTADNYAAELDALEAEISGDAE